MHILVVDDSKTDRVIVKKMLEEDFRVTTLSSAREAKAFAASNSFDVVLINSMLQPHPDSIALLQELRVIHLADFKSFAITSRVDKVRHHQLLRAGFNGVLQKPFAYDAFMHLLMDETSLLQSKLV